jgi:hypothetical protein
MNIKRTVYTIIYWLSHFGGMALCIYSVVENKIVAFLASVLLLAYSTFFHICSYLVYKATENVNALRKGLIDEFKKKGLFKDPDSVK